MFPVAAVYSRGHLHMHTIRMYLVAIENPIRSLRIRNSPGPETSKSYTRTRAPQTQTLRLKWKYNCSLEL